PLLGPETQRLTIQGLGEGDKFTLNILKVPLQVAYSGTAATILGNLQSALDSAFGENVFQAYSINATQVDIAPGIAQTNVAGSPLQPTNAGTANFDTVNQVGVPLIGPLVSNANLPLISGSFGTSEVQRINIPANITNNQTFNLSFLGRS